MKKKIYVQPCIRTIDLFEESAILVESGNLQNQETFGVSDTYADSEALSSKQNMWERENIWK